MKKANLGWSTLALLVIIVAAIFVRTYKFDDWLYFKMDQSRDSLLIANAVQNGPQYLPLLGARAGAVKLKHGYLRLGPIFYYFEYASGVLFHSTQPYVFAYPDLFFSILAIPMLYLLLRLYFSKKHSLLITAMYAFSFIIIQYSRFSWNPNDLQFFLLLTFYGLLRMLNEPDEKRRRWWIALWALGLTIGSQLHFFGFFSLIGISGLLIAFHLQLWKKAEIQACFKETVLKKFAVYAGIVAVVFLIFYTPVIISDTQRNFQNSKNFIEALTAKQDKKPLTQRITKGATENLKYYCLISTSECYGSSMSKEIPAITLTALILLIGFVLNIRALKKATNSNPLKKDFLALVLIWVAVFTILTIPVSFQLRPRFFIVVFATPFIFLGFLYQYLEEKISKQQAFAVALLLTMGIIGWNSYGTSEWFKEQAKSQKSAFIVKRTLILKAKDGVTLGQLQGVTDWMYARHQAGSTLYYYAKPEHVRPLQFLLWQKHDLNLTYKPLEVNQDEHAQYFAMTPTKSGLEPVYSKYGNDITVLAQKQFGQVTAWEISFNNRQTSPTFRFNKTKTKTDRVFWKDVLGIKDNNPDAAVIDSAE